MIGFIKKLFGPSSSDKLRNQIEDKNREIDRLKTKLTTELSKAVKMDSRVRFELKAEMDTKIRVWWRENKEIHPLELESKFNAMKKEIDKIEGEIKRNRVVEANIDYPVLDKMDFTMRNHQHVGLSKTSN